LQKIIGISILDRFTEWLVGQRYTKLTIRSYLFGVVDFASWARKRGYPDSSAFDSKCLSIYRGHLIKSRGGGARAANLGNALCSANTFVRFLRHDGLVADVREEIPLVVSRFGEWMRSHRGVRESTLANYHYVVSKLVRKLGSETRSYSAAQLRDFILAESHGYSHSKADTYVTSVRMFVRFMIAHGECSDALQYAIPRVGKWGKAALPRYIEQDAVEQIISACEPNTPVGIRDRAVILLLARLGLRAGDVAKLCLDDLDWIKGRIRVCGKARTPAWLPLPQDAGDAVLEYLTKVRTRVTTDRVFLIMRAPYTPILSRQITSTAARAIKRAGIATPSLGAHLFRHSAATGWLRQGLSLQSIGAVLRHSDLDTTAIYAKVDVRSLQQIATPWPGERGTC
jgi:site-specific recombinase XerD